MTLQELIATAELSSDQATLVTQFAAQKIRVAAVSTSDDGELWQCAEIVRIEQEDTKASIEHAYRSDLKIPADVKVDVAIYTV